MQDMIPKGTGNSRLMKSSIPASTTHQELVDMLRNGTFPFDLGNLNSAGVQQTGTALNKANLLADATAALLGLSSNDATVNTALYQLLATSNFLSKYVSTGMVDVEEFNTFCASQGVSIKATWAATCADTTAKAQIMNSGTLMAIIMSQPTLQASFGAVAFTLDNIKSSIKGGWYKAWPIGSTVDIALSAFTMQASFTAGTYTFELVGIDQDKDPNGNTLPLTLFTKHLIGTAGFKMNASSDNTFASSYAYTQRANLKGALPSTWQSAMAPLVRKQIMSKGSGGTLTNYDLPCFLYREGEIFPTKTYSDATEFGACKRYQIYEDGLGTLIKKYSNGAGSATGFWECSPYSGNAGDFCLVYSGGNAGYSGASNAIGLCFGFCLARDQT